MDLDKRQFTRRKRYGPFFKCELPMFECSRAALISPDGKRTRAHVARDKSGY